ncbi:ketoacyl-synthetase C-terminal extension domain-containing protein [Streptomyces sp. FXJ1.4098]|nr:ketoacyl-synthetase C-terminal extension domain-containing protein [Streptomyces sp. FXJ1.4098]
MVLKPLAAAEADGDHIYAVIAATAVGHGGAVSGFSVPSPVGQAAVVSAALAAAGVDARSIGYVEAHGTGTSLGDPIEVRGLTAAFAKDTSDTGFCALGSVKSTIGHAESAAGIAGLTKAVLQLHHRTLVPSLHADTVNPLLRLDDTPFRLQRETTAWPAPPEGPRRAGLSSFGATGAGAHIVLEEYLPAEPAGAGEAAEGPVVVPLSARAEDRLRELAARLRDALTAGTPGRSLRDIAYTLQVGRVEWPVRAAFVVRDLAELAGQLDEFAASGARPGLPGTELGGTARRWAEGGAVDWAALYGAGRPRRTSLPTYPFAGERHWIPAEGEDTEGRRPTAPGVTPAAAPGAAALAAADGAPTAAPGATAPAARADGPGVTAQAAAGATPVPVPVTDPAPVVPPQGLLTAPRWVESAAPVPAAGRAPRAVLIVAEETGTPLALALAEHYRSGDGAPEVAECALGGPLPLGGPDAPAPDRVHIVVGAGPVGRDAAAEHELALLRLVKALSRLGADRSTPMDLSVVTQETQSVAGEPSGARGAGLAGLVYFLARDSQRFAVRNLDVAGADLTTPAGRAKVAAAVAAEPRPPVAIWSRCAAGAGTGRRSARSTRPRRRTPGCRGYARAASTWWSAAAASSAGSSAAI